MLRPVTAALLSLAAVTIAADPLHEIARGVHQHEDSGWIFPQVIAGFERVGVPYTVDGTTHVSAHYRLGAPQARARAIVHVLPAMEADSQTCGLDASGRSTWSARTPDGRVLIGERHNEKQEKGGAWRYWGTAEGWSVVICVSSTGVAAGAMTLAGDFAEQQRWDTLGLPAHLD